MTSVRQEIADFKAFRRALLRERAKAAPNLQQFREEFDALNAAIPLPDECSSTAIDDGRVSGYRLAPRACDSKRALLYHHGGGHTFGSPESHSHLVGRLAAAAGVVGYNMFYRLAPENPFPAGLEDALANYQWLLSQGFEPNSIVIGGESAGGNLTVALALMIRKLGLPRPAGLYLLSPWLDLNHKRISHLQMAQADVILNSELVERCATAYCAGSTSRDDPLVSPLLADLRDLPPTMIQVGGSEILLSDSVDFASAAALAGVDIFLRVYPDQVHCWPMFHPAMPAAATQAIEEAAGWVRRTLDNGLR